MEPSRRTIFLLVLRLKDAGRQKRRLNQTGSSDATSMGDVAFLLLIFFIVTTSFILRQGIFFSLPSQSAGSQTIDPEKIINVTPAQEGYHIDDELITADLFEKKLQSRISTQPDLVVLITMPKQLSYERLVHTLSLVKENGIRRVSVKQIEEES